MLEQQFKDKLLNSGTQSTLSDQPLTQDLAERENKKSNRARIREEILPFRLLPNVSSIRVVTSENDKLFEAFGIKKSRAKAKLEIIPANNARYNRYLIFKLRYLRKVNTLQYWKQTEQLLRNSSILYVSAVHHVMEGWTFNNTPWNVRRQIRKAKEYAVQELKPLESKRFYVEKANGKSRPIAAPTAAGKMFQHLLNNFLAFRLKDKIAKNQHGFISGRGTMSAWKKILTEVVKSPNIYEIDLKSAFDSITQKHIARTLDKHGVPKGIASKILLSSLSPISMPESSDMVKMVNPIGIHAQENKLIKKFDEDQYRWLLFWNSIMRICLEHGIKERDLYRLLVKCSSNFWKGNKTYFKDLEIKRLKSQEVGGVPTILAARGLEDMARLGLVEVLTEEDGTEYLAIGPANKFVGEDGWYLKRMLRKIINSDSNLDWNSEIMIDKDGIHNPYEPSSIRSSVSYKDLNGGVRTFRGSTREIRDHLKQVVIRAVEKYKRFRCGVAQGCPTSPFIFALCVNDMFFNNPEGINCVAYADDAVFYGPNLKDEKQILKRASVHSGLEFNLDKCGWIKQENKWLKELKFLGMSYSNKTDRITWSSQTRSGISLEFDKSLLVYLYLKGHRGRLPLDDFEIEAFNVKMPEYIEEKVLKTEEINRSSFIEKRTWIETIKKLQGYKTIATKDEAIINALFKEEDILSELTNSDIFGLIQSRMYVGSWANEVRQNFVPSFRTDSWFAEQKKRNLHFNIFNSSSYAVEELIKNPKGKTPYNFKTIPRRYEDCLNPSSYKLRKYPIWWDNRNPYMDAERRKYYKSSIFYGPKIINKSLRKTTNHFVNTGLKLITTGWRKNNWTFK